MRNEDLFKAGQAVTSAEIMKKMHAPQLGAEHPGMKPGLYLQVRYKHLRTGINQRNLCTVVDNGEKTLSSAALPLMSGIFKSC